MQLRMRIELGTYRLRKRVMANRVKTANSEQSTAIHFSNWFEQRLQHERAGMRRS